MHYYYLHKVFMGLRGDWKRETKERPTKTKKHTYGHICLGSVLSLKEWVIGRILGNERHALISCVSIHGHSQ